MLPDGRNKGDAVEPYDPGVGVQTSCEVRVAAQPADKIGVLQVEMIEGQQAATRHRHTGSRVFLQVGDAERKLQSPQSSEDLQPPSKPHLLGSGHLKCPQTVEAELENLYLSVRRATARFLL